MIEMIEASPMRLTPEQIDTIRATARETFGPEARVWLFDSRVDDQARLTPLPQAV